MSQSAAARAGIWSALEIGAKQIAQFGLAVVLSRLLAPSDFGAMALLVLLLSLAQSIVVSGLTSALIQRDTSRAQQSSIFWLAFGLSAALGGAMMLATPWLARTYGILNLSAVMPFMVANLLALAFASVPTALMIRRGEFRKIAISSLSATALGTLVGLGLGLAGFGIWALIGNLVVINLVHALLLWMLFGWRPIAHFRLQDIRPLLQYGSWIGISSLLEVLYTQGYALVLGRLYGLSDLGVYSRANNLPMIAHAMTSNVIGRVTLPLFSYRKDDPVSLLRALLRTNRITILITLPLAVGLATASDIIIRVLFGPQWTAAAPVLTVIAATGVLLSLQASNGQILLAVGKSAFYFRIELARKLVGIMILLFGSDYGLMGLAWAQLIAVFFGTIIGLVASGRYTGVGLFRQVADVSGIIFVGLAMGGVILAVQAAVSLPPLVELVMLVAVGGCTYLLLGFLFRVPAFVDMVAIGQGLLQRERASTLIQQP